MAKLSALCRWTLLIAACGLGLGRGWGQETAAGATPEVTIAPRSSAVVSARVIDAAPEPAISAEEKLELIRRHIKYVFVLFQENRSFDFYFGTYPGADGLYAGPNGPYASGQVAGFTQAIVNTDGTLGTVTPFKIPATVTDAAGKIVPLYPADIASVNHSHVATVRKIALDANGVAQNSEYALTEEGVTLVNGKPSAVPSLERKQFGELVMSHVDCDTVPFLWRYADRFTLFDHFMDTIVGPSTPAGCSRRTQNIAARYDARHIHHASPLHLDRSSRGHTPAGTSPNSPHSPRARQSFRCPPAHPADQMPGHNPVPSSS